MNTAPQLTAQEFSDIHNAKCEIYSIANSLEGVISERLYARIEKAIQLLNKGLERAYEEDNAAEEKRSAHYNKISEEYGFKSIWSVYEVDDLNAPFAGAATHLAYKQHWGKKPVLVPINGNTWVDLWRAAEAAILESGDNHHIFIESFEPDGDSGILNLSTGS